MEPAPPASSSSHSPAITPPSTSGDDRDEIDLLGRESHDIGDERQATGRDADVLDDDPIHGDLRTPMSFKRRQKPTSGLFGFLGSLASGGRAGEAGGSATPPVYDASGSPSARGAASSPPYGADAAASSGPTFLGFGAGPSNNVLNAGVDTKDGSTGAPLDWYMEGPGRRVGYDDLTAIDWIFEYSKERQRQRVMASSSGGGMTGYLRQLIDSSQVWVVLLLTGVLVGSVAACINITSDWLGDLKEGFCASGPEGGHFYLSKSFCCYGYDQGSKCVGWKTWGEALGVSAAAGKWIIGYIFFLVFSVFLAYCAALLVQQYALYAKHSGIPELKTVLGGFVIRRFLGSWTLLTKSVGLVLAVASGMWLGKEGPLVHVACCCANVFIKLFPNINGNEARKREVLSAAAASGISVAFGSPIGGVLFSLETLSYYFPDKTMWQSFVCAMTAAVALQAFDPFRSGKLVLYQTKYSSDWHDFEIIPYAILGIFGGLYGGVFIKLNMAVSSWKKGRSWLPGPVTQVVAVACLTALINYPNFYMKVQTSELVSNLFTECAQVLEDPIGLCKTGAASASTIVLLLFAAVLGFLLASITFGLQIPAGIILPSMAIGALVGRAVGIIMEIWVDNHPGFFPFAASCEPDARCITPGTYAIIGAAAALAGVTRMTVSIVVIMFELTGALTYVLPIMVAVMISKWVGDAFSRRGIYESWIHLNEYPYIDNSEEMPVPDIPTSQVMTRIEDLVVLTATGHTIASLNSVLDAHAYRGFPVISDPRDAILLGYISRADLRHNLAAAVAPPRSLSPDAEAFFAHQPLADPRSTLDLRPWMDQTPLTLSSSTALHLAVSYFQKLGLRYVLFADRGVLHGLLTKKDVWYVLEGAEETRRTGNVPGGGGPGTSGHRPQGQGVTREDGENEERGLLRGEDDDDDEDQVVDVRRGQPIL